ncbi:MAG TPA: DAK2 domain-containing protein [Pseudogracilibacillus sp.]|nr:DAK2 domain-containing protein [Pseudogracilibacillus sp.]
MSMRLLTGQMFKKMIQLAEKHLLNNKDKINDLNVFPVPDGDTGTNMSLTMTSGLKEVSQISSDSISDVASAFSKGLLMGARGNSGVILSQIFRGFNAGLTKKEEVTPEELAEAFTNGVTMAYQAVTNPVEGTILTVAKDSAIIAKESNKTEDIIELMTKVTNEARRSLEYTPELLPILKEVGVVDSGGKGLLVIYEGFLAALTGDSIEDITSKEDNIDIKIKHEHEDSVQSFIDIGSIEHGYCTEFIVELDNEKLKSNSFKEQAYRTQLDEYGDSLLIAADEGLVKVHIHTEKPGDVMTLSQQYGDLMNIDIENMRKQYEAIILEDTAKETQGEPVEVAKIVVSSGKGVNSMFESLGADYIIPGGQTMNPSTEDILTAIEKVNAKKVYIFPNNKNIILSANQAADIVEQTVHVIPTKTIPQGIAALFVYDEDKDSDVNTTNMLGAIGDVKTGLITYAVRDTEVNNIKIKKNDFMGLSDDSIKVTHVDKVETTKELLYDLIDEEDEILTIFYGEDMTEAEKVEIVSYIEETFEDLEAEFYDGDQPVYSLIIMVE